LGGELGRGLREFRQGLADTERPASEDAAANDQSSKTDLKQA
jgi:Sec-independent protein translocase protein TatA